MMELPYMHLKVALHWLHLYHAKNVHYTVRKPDFEFSRFSKSTPVSSSKKKASCSFNFNFCSNSKINYLEFRSEPGIRA